MGTSSSQGSPSTHAWDAARAAYQSSSVAMERVSHLVWRAASASSIAEQLSSDLVQHCLQVGSAAKTAPEAIERITDAVVENGSTNFAVDLARRAVLTTFSAPNRYEAATQALFAEAARYLVSRDAPTFLGLGSRFAKLTQVSELEDRVARLAREVTAKAGTAPRDAKRWAKHVEAILSKLKGLSK